MKRFFFSRFISLTMLSSLVVFVLSLAISFSTLSYAEASKITVGLVDVQKVLLAIDEGKTIRKRLEEDFKKKQDLLKKDEGKFKELQDKFEKQRLVLNESAKLGKEKELRDLYVGIQEKTMKYQQELQELERDLKRPLIDKIKTVVESISKNSNVDMTFEIGTTPLVYAENKKDLTEEVISSYNKQYPVK
ncbi:MAG: OmpH family outer membrane protein [Oligoflexia bacterium]|nr:OmpH family outer membrane protein [Oligoflexia bacterium]